MKISIIIPTYNRVSTVTAAIDSVLDQEFSNLEILVIDDGSTDSTQEVLLARYPTSEKKVFYYQQENTGCASARNRGLREFTGDAFIFLDSDDQMVPGALKKLERIMIERDAEFVYSPALEVPASGSPWINFPVAANRPNRLAEKYFLNTNIRNGSVLFMRSVVKKVGFLDESLRYNEDSDYIQRVALNCKGAYSPEPSVKVFHHENNKSSDRVAIYKALLFSSERTLHNYPQLKRKLGKAGEQRLQELRQHLITALIHKASYEEAKQIVLKGVSLPPQLKMALFCKSPWPIRVSEHVSRWKSRLMAKALCFNLRT